MPQAADKILDHEKLFREPEYKDMLAKKRSEFEFRVPLEDLQKTNEWTKSWDYREKNLAREALTVNPAKACQPRQTGSALGYEACLLEIRP